ncbi:RDD family protein [Chitinimonas lacunae]|uniref:RDD family protein n=1 Tax=Chitinimonas lacunae TaxID=1963018 RepID=A0ABV8MT46_9NEIS
MTETSPHPTAPRWRRLVSLCYEALLLVAVLMACGMLFDLVLGRLAPGSQGQSWRSHLQFVYLLAMLWGYFIWCWRRSGQTLAMKTWRLRLDARSGGRANLKSLSLRFTLAVLMLGPALPLWIEARHRPELKWLGWAALVWAALPYLWAWLDRDRQFLHDRLAGTRLVLLPIGYGKD